SRVRLPLLLANHPSHSGPAPRPLAARRHPRSAMARRSLNPSRRLYLCLYDVLSTKEGDKRRTRLYDLLRDYGEHVHYSVFLCELAGAERTRLLSAARRILNENEDQLLVLDIGPETFEWISRLDCLGKSW